LSFLSRKLPRAAGAGWLLLLSLVCGARPALADGEILLGLVPSEDPSALVNDNQAIISALEASLGMKVKPFIATDYNGVIEALRAKRLDIAMMGPFAYVLASTIAEVDPIAIPDLANQGPFYHSLVITRKDTGIHRLADLKGHTFAFVDPSSTSGHLFPKTGMLQAGINPDTDMRAIFAGSHDASVLALLNGKVDAAAVADRLLDAVIGRGLAKREDLVVVWQSEPIPGAPVVMRRDLPEDFKVRLRAAFAAMHDVPWSKGTIIKSWVPATDQNFEVVRGMAKLLNLDLSKMK
jgi:phosphonate transport system substrate-binding protein